MSDTKKYTMDDYALELRHDVLITALVLEKLSAKYLAALLGIKDYKTTKSFGNKSGNLSFNQKIELLIDIDALSKEEKKKFQTFMEIRNQFMHNIDVKSYTECFDMLEGKENFILKLYPLEVDTIKEVKLRIATERLAVELVDTLNKLINKIAKYNLDKLKFETLEVIHPKYVECVNGMKNIYKNHILNKLDLDKNINQSELSNLDKEIRTNFKGFWDLEKN
ncbi:hypothetical protein [Flavobacterium suncheonense]|uniref:Uncharacterized protein n=1 Tax=Flavobacterium suncheonense GH29-5 = DSM 17707 TaxID=1121899 RepID=A0A0A2LZ82_9FLAO|nr:hypothetical protein [Flavobacterium suncheonense]KGO85329.1 hypothetical protein Q764_14145 [Flavobacterium suncheonense GH29-5 = DSM 17707]